MRTTADIIARGAIEDKAAICANKVIYMAAVKFHI